MNLSRIHNAASSKINKKIPAVEFNGHRIYMAESKINTIKSHDSWTYSRIQLEFKIGFNQAKLLVSYAQSLGVLSAGSTTDYGTKFEVTK